jgi:hypothetical protein
MRKAVVMIAAGVIAVLLGGWIVAGYLPTKGIETPKYELVTKAKGYEVRAYAPHIIAEVEVSGSYGESLNQGFRKVADYIFGNNTAKDSIAMTAPVLHEKQSASEKIAMTAPVLHEKAGEKDSYKLAFVMPSKYTMETLPKPNNAEVTLRAIPEKKFAVRSFGGYATQAKVERETKKLLDALKTNNITPSSGPSTAQYNPPWTPPFMRHNEVMVEVK